MAAPHLVPLGVVAIGATAGPADVQGSVVESFVCANALTGARNGAKANAIAIIRFGIFLMFIITSAKLSFVIVL